MTPIFVLLAVGLVGEAGADTQGGPASRPVPRLGIFQVSMAGVDPALQTAAIDALATAAGQTGLFQVVSRTELDQMLGAEKTREALGCEEMSCLAEIGAAAGVDRVVGGSVSRVDGALIVSLQLVNAVYASTENRITLTWRGEAAELPELLGVAAELLLVPMKERAPGAVSITGVPAAAIISIDGKPVSSGPAEVSGIEAGVHTVRVEAADYETLEQSVLVRMGQTQRLSPLLNPRAAAPFYTRWWFWTGVGVVVAGGAAAAIAATRDHGGGGGDMGNDTVDVTFTGTAPGALGGRP